MFKLENYSRIEIIFEFVRKLYSYLKKIVSNEKKITRSSWMEDFFAIRVLSVYNTMNGLFDDFRPRQIPKRV